MFWMGEKHMGESFSLPLLGSDVTIAKKMNRISTQTHAISVGNATDFDASQYLCIVVLVLVNT